MNKLLIYHHYSLKKPVLLLLLALAFHFASAQSLLLFSDTIPPSDTMPGSQTYLILNSTAVGANHGNNQWIINNQYNGQGAYPDTRNEDSVVGGLGQITGAPYSNYLHIHDVAENNGAANANWNPNSGSDRFCYYGNSFCSAGLTNVIFNFFWTGQGDSTAYGRIYYSTDGGVTWAQTGQPKYYNQPDWKYESIQDTNFNNQPNLQFGFRWTNNGSDTTHDVSWGIADIIAVGTYDSITNPAVLTILSVTPDTICENSTITINFSLTPPLCEGNCIVYLSDSTGSFAHPTVLNPAFGLGPYSIFWSSPPINIPAGLHGGCFKIKMKWISLTENFSIWSDTSLCFAIVQCPVTVTTNSVPVMTDPDSACVRSAFDAFFNSTGNFNNNNIYYAQLSDSNGSFGHPDTIGHKVSNQSYPPGGSPGDVSGLIPASVPPGCGYYVRVVSSNPPSIGNAIGPFCITDCDITTNNTQDLNACINYPYPTDTLTFTIATNQWNQGASYDTCNNWTVEVLDEMSFSVINIGGLGVYHDTAGGTFTLIVPTLNQLAALGIFPGTYYLRILSNCSTEPWNENGTVIRITIGAPAVPLAIYSATGTDSVYCDGGSMEVFVTPYNQSSTYNWTSNFFLPISAPGILVSINGAAPVGGWVAYVQEITSNGCPGPVASYNFVTTKTPVGIISGPQTVCIGDTVVFNSTYYPATYYDWTAPPGVQIVLQSNTQVSMVFDTLGTYTIQELSINTCGSYPDSLAIKVRTLFDVDLGPNKMDCIGDSVTLTASVPPYPKTFISLDSSTAGNQGGMFNILPLNDIIIDSFAVSFRTHVANTRTSIYSKQGSYRGFEQTRSSWTFLDSAIIPSPAPVLSKTVIPVELNMSIPAGDTTAFYITTTNSNPNVNEAYGNGIGIQQGTLYKSDGVIDFIQGCENAYPFGAHAGPKVLNVTIYYRTKAGLKYLWNNGDTTSSISFLPPQSQFYEVKVYDTTGCRAFDTVYVKVDTLPKVYAGPDTALCPYIPYIMPAIASPSASVVWAPVTGLNFPDTLRPVFNYYQTTGFVVTATNPDGCKGYDSVNISVYSLSVNAGPDTTICDGETYLMAGTASTDSVEWIPSVGLSAVNIVNPVFNYGQTTKYYLQVTDSAGCKLNDSVTINVMYCNSYIKVPQAFTPNNDGVNDYFTVFGEYISDYQIKIFNRWGEEVYSSNDVNELNNLGRGWDGRYKGKLQDVGTFVYEIQATDLNGKNIFKKGNLTLIR